MTSTAEHVDITEDEGNFSEAVGERLRSIRKSRRWSLDDVERISDGRWSASALGAYERGYRNLSLPRLQELAGFFGVSMAYLLGEPERPVQGDRRIVLDLVKLEQVDEAEPVIRYARGIKNDRGDHDSMLLSVRKDDLRALCTMLDSDEDELISHLQRWGALAAPAA